VLVAFKPLNISKILVVTDSFVGSLQMFFLPSVHIGVARAQVSWVFLFNWHGF